MGFNMKKRVRIILVIIVILAMITTNVYASDYPTYDVTLNSGDVVEANQYSEERFNGEYDPEFKCVKTVTINALGEEPIVIKRSAFSGSVTRQVEHLVINGTGKIILSSFAFCYTGITDIDIPSNVVFENGAECVFGSSFLRRATIRSDLCPAMFQECWSLIYVNFLNQNIKKIPVDCFDTCGLLSITIPSSVTEIEDGAFHSTFYLERVNLNEGLESIGNRSFENSNSIKELKFPSTLKSIGEKSFYETSSLVKLELNDGLETIGENAFRGCRSLKSVTIPASVTSIGEKAFGYFYDTQKIDGFTIYGYRGTAAETYANENGFTFIPLDSTDPNDIDVVLNSGDVVEAGQYSEPDEYASDYKAVGTVTFNATGSEPITVKRLGFSGNSSFSNNVKNIIFNGNGEIILDSLAFSCSCVTTLYLPSNVHFADDAEYVFDGAKNLKKAIVACKLCPNMFSESKELREVEFSQGNNLEELPDEAFYLCSSLEKINFPSTLKRIGASCFYYSNLSDVKLNEGLETIDEYAFYFAANCNSIEFPSTLKSIGKSAFLGCPFNAIQLNDGLSSVGEKAFYGNNFKFVIIPASVTSIGEKAFGFISDSKTIDGFTIYGYRGTAAETYANENGFTFIPLDSESSVKGVTYNPSWSSVNDYSFTVNDRADKVQVIEATGATRTFARNNSNVVIKGYDAEGNEVSSLSRELDHEVWTIRTRLTPNSDLQVHAKYKNEWESLTYYFSVSTLSSDKTLKSAELSSTSGNPDSVECKIVTGSGVNKVRIEYDDGMTTTVASSMAVLDEANMTYTYNLSVKPRHSGENNFKIYIKNPTDGWTYATTLTYTVE